MTTPNLFSVTEGTTGAHIKFTIGYPDGFSATESSKG